jgi:hypothetical protein
MMLGKIVGALREWICVGASPLDIFAVSIALWLPSGIVCATEDVYSRV